MHTVTKEIVKTALANDIEASPEERKRILAALSGDDPNRRPTLITRRRASEILDCSTKTIERYAKRGLLKELRYSARRIRFDEAEVLRLAREGVEA